MLSVFCAVRNGLAPSLAGASLAKDLGATSSDTADNYIFFQAWISFELQVSSIQLPHLATISWRIHLPWLPFQTVHSYYFLKDICPPLAEQEYPMTCLACGFHPSLLYFDANRKTCFSLREKSGWSVKPSEAAVEIDIDKYWLDLEERTFLRHRFVKNTSKSSDAAPMNASGMLCYHIRLS